MKCLLREHLQEVRKSQPYVFMRIVEANIDKIMYKYA